MRIIYAHLNFITYLYTEIYLTEITGGIRLSCTTSKQNIL